MVFSWWPQPFWLTQSYLCHKFGSGPLELLTWVSWWSLFMMIGLTTDLWVYQDIIRIHFIDIFCFSFATYVSSNQWLFHLETVSSMGLLSWCGPQDITGIDWPLSPVLYHCYPSTRQIVDCRFMVGLMVMSHHWESCLVTENGPFRVCVLLLGFVMVTIIDSMVSTTLCFYITFKCTSVSMVIPSTPSLHPSPTST